MDRLPVRLAIILLLFAVSPGGCIRLHAQPLRPQPSSPLGASPDRSGVTFRVWAPYAEGALVRVNQRDPVPMTREPGRLDPAVAIWTLHVAGSKSGDRYQYFLTDDGVARPFVDPAAQQVIGYDNNAWSVVVDRSPVRDRFKEPPFNQLVVYELHIGSFNESSRSHQFSFAGAAERLPYLHRLGINAIELMPINLNPINLGHVPPQYNWGYDGLHLYAINPSYGSPAEFKKFVQACHSHGIAVILDVVYNHLTGGNLLEQFGGVSTREYRDGPYFYPGAAGRSPWGPRPDYSRPEVRHYLEDNALTWMYEYGVDGERWDSVDNIRFYHPPGARSRIPLPGGDQLLREYNEARPGEKISISENLGLSEDTVRPINAGGLGFDSRWDDALLIALRPVLTAPGSAGLDLAPLANVLKKRFGDSAFHRIAYTEDHDTVGHPNDRNQTRLPAVIDPEHPESLRARRLSTLAGVIVLTTPGIPMLFQGQEMLDPPPFSFGSITPVDWSRTGRFGGIVHLYRDLIALRRNLHQVSAALSEENVEVFHLDNRNETLAYRRFGQGGTRDNVIIAANFSSRPLSDLEIGFPRPGRWRVRLNSASSSYDADVHDSSVPDPVAQPGERDGLPFHGALSLAPYSAVILSQ